MPKRQIIINASKALGILPTLKTDPAIIRDILQEMRMEDFETHYVPMKKFLRDVMGEAQELRPAIRCIQEALVRKHPAIVEFLEVALQKKWLKPSPLVIRAMHVGYLLEAFTVAMCNDHAFFMDVHRHITKKGKESGIDPHNYFTTFFRAWQVSKSVFETAKALSVDPAMIYFRTEKGLGSRMFSCAEVRRMHKKGFLNYVEEHLLMPPTKGHVEHFDDLIRTNIYEAGITDFLSHLAPNADCAEALCEDMVTMKFEETMHKKHVLPEQLVSNLHKSIASSRAKSMFPIVAFSPEWVRLYITWNAAFVIGNIADVESVLPKLFIPSIIDCTATNFIGARAVSLWLCIWHNFFRREQRGIAPAKVKKRMKAMARAWGKINLRHAQALMMKDRKESPEALRRNSKNFYTHPFWHWIQAASFLWN